jgi:hypothetical protein
MINLLKPKSTASQPISQPIETAAAFEETMSPPSVAKATEEAAAQVGIEINENIRLKVARGKMPNEHYVYVKVPNWEPLALCSVQNSADWSANEDIHCRLVKANPAGVLIFENRDGIRRNRWRR